LKASIAPVTPGYGSGPARGRGPHVHPFHPGGPGRRRRRPVPGSSDAGAWARDVQTSGRWASLAARCVRDRSRWGADWCRLRACASAGRIVCTLRSGPGGMAAGETGRGSQAVIRA
jgi:hypothetical protein